MSCGLNLLAEQPDDAIDVANGGNLRRAHDDRFVRACNGILEAEFDAGRAIDQHVVETFAQRLDQRAHLLGVDFVLLACLRRGKQR